MDAQPHPEAMRRAEEIRRQYPEMTEEEFRAAVIYLAANLPLQKTPITVTLGGQPFELIEAALNPETVQTIRKMAVGVASIGFVVFVAAILYETYCLAAPIIAKGTADFFAGFFDGAKAVGEVVGWVIIAGLATVGAAMLITAIAKHRRNREPEIEEIPDRAGTETAADFGGRGIHIHNHISR